MCKQFLIYSFRTCPNLPKKNYITWLVIINFALSFLLSLGNLKLLMWWVALHYCYSYWKYFDAIWNLKFQFLTFCCYFVSNLALEQSLDICTIAILEICMVFKPTSLHIILHEHDKSKHFLLESHHFWIFLVKSVTTAPLETVFLVLECGTNSFLGILFRFKFIKFIISFHIFYKIERDLLDLISCVSLLGNS